MASYEARNSYEMLTARISNPAENRDFSSEGEFDVGPRVFLHFDEIRQISICHPLHHQAKGLFISYDPLIINIKTSRCIVQLIKAM